jgi:oligopeptide/dipeptide ABC transporter ATP-binding protein
MNQAEPLLSIRDLRLGFEAPDGVAVALDGVSLDVAEGETLGIVGESGCGKSVTALSVLRLAGASARVLSGSIRFAGQDLLTLPDAAMTRIRGAAIGMIFQEPLTSLTPVFTIGEQITEHLRRHLGLGRRAALDRAAELLDQVGIPSPRQRLGNYPHELSGGMRQRVMIAIALACRPRLLLADEPTTALDVTVQAQILELLARLRSELGTAIVLITHDLGVIAEFADRVLVMYAGRVVEQAATPTLFEHPQHPYTQGLLRSVPPIDHDVERLTAIPGSVPALHAMPPGCRFAPRCVEARPKCSVAVPPLRPTATGGDAACILPAAPAKATTA